jgi:hypothetical protein
MNILYPTNASKKPTSSLALTIRCKVSVVGDGWSGILDLRGLKMFSFFILLLFIVAVAVVVAVNSTKPQQ